MLSSHAAHLAPQQRQLRPWQGASSLEIPSSLLPSSRERRRARLRPRGAALAPRAAASADRPASRRANRTASTSPPSTEPPPLLVERGMPFSTGGAFFRPQSAQGRDLALLAAALHRRRAGSLRVLDCMSGSGMRAARFLYHAGADSVLANDVNEGTPLEENLARVADRSRRGLTETGSHIPQQTRAPR